MKRSTFISAGILLGLVFEPWLPSDVLTGRALAQTSSGTPSGAAAPAPSTGSVGIGRIPPQDVEIKQVSPGEWQEEYRQINELIQRYDENVTSFRKDVQTIINQKYRDELERIQQTYDTMYKKLDDEARVRREQAIAAFERFIQKYPDTEHTPLAMSRLAELYYDQASYDFLTAQAAWEELTRQIADSKAFPEEPRYDYAKSLALYDRIVKEFQNFKYIDEVYYMRGYLLGKELAVQYNAEAARDAWFELIKRRPDSVYASQAYLRIGDYYFEKGSRDDLNVAITYYQRVMSYQDKLYDRALYKLAWTYYRLNDFDNAIAKFIDLIDFSQTKLAETGRESDLRTEAVTYLAISLADHPAWTVNDVQALFKKIGDRPYKLEVLKKLADVYFRQANYDESVATYALLQQLDPLNEENPTYQSRIVQIRSTTLTGAGPEESLKAKEALIKNYSPDSPWAIGQTDKAAVTKAQELSQQALQELAFYYHDLAGKATTDADKQKYFAMAAEKYNEYLKRFPYSPNAYELQFFFAECLFLSHRYEESAVQYEIAMTSTDPKYHADAARGRVDSYQELVAKEGELGFVKPFPKPEEKDGEKKDEKKDEGVPPPIELSPLKKKLVQSIDILARISPNQEDTPSYLFIAATMHFYHRHYKESERRYTDLIEQYPNHKLSVPAAANIIDGLLAQQEWKAIMDTVDKLGVRDLGSDPKEWTRVRTQLLDIRSKAQLKYAEWLKKKDWRIAHEEYRKQGTDVGLYFAAKTAEEVGQVDVALDDYLDLVRQYPKSEHVQTALWQIASNYEKYFDLPKAIDYYERLANTYPKSENAANSIYNAAFLRVGLHQYKEAARGYERYSLNYPNQPDAEAMMFYAALNYWKADEFAESLRAFREYQRRYSKSPHAERMVDSQLHVVNSLEKLGRGKDAITEEGRTSGIVATVKDLPTWSPRATYLYATIMFKDMDRTLKSFLDVKLTGSSTQQKKALERKLQLLADLERKMGDMIRIGDVEWSSAALYSMGLACHSLADALVEAIPTDLSPDDIELYRQLLDESYVGPLEERALGYYKRNLEIEAAQKTWNKWIEMTYSQLNRLRPEEFPARKKEQYQFIPGEQEFSAPPIQTIPMANASALNEGTGTAR